MEYDFQIILLINQRNIVMFLSCLYSVKISNWVLNRINS